MTRRRDEFEEAPERAPVPLATPDEWRVLLGTRASHFAAARICHGWLEHEHHEGQPMRLSEAAYLAAVAGGLKMPPQPTPDASSPHRGRGR